MQVEEIRINNPREIHRLLSRTIRQLLKDEITDSKAKAVGYLCSIILKVSEQGEMLDRMDKLEKQLLLKRGA